MPIYSGGPYPGVWKLSDVSKLIQDDSWPVDISDRALFKSGPGSAPSYSFDNVIEYISLATSGNAADFGDTTETGTTNNAGIVSSSTRGLFFGFTDGPFTSATNTINAITMASLGNATDFGDVTTKRLGMGGASNSTRGVCAGGFPAPGGFPTVNTIEYVEIASTGNTSDFGDLTLNRNSLASFASPTRGCFAGGNNSPTAPANTTNVIDYITIGSTGNAVDFGDLTINMRQNTGLSSSTRGLSAGSNIPVSNVISYITIASTGNATDFGDLLSSVNYTLPGSNSITGIFAGGSVSPSEVATDVINAVTIASTGNATDFGDLSRAGRVGGGCSVSHGGLT